MLGDGIARAATRQPSNSPILVSLFLQGGLDSLSLLAPAGDPLYEKLRPRLAVAPGSGVQLREDPSLTWHPSAAAIANLHNAGKVLVFPGIGYADEDMSHFTSRHYWEVGATNAEMSTGWRGRYIDLAGDPTNPFQGLSLDGQINPTLATAKHPVAAIDQPTTSRCGSTVSGARQPSGRSRPLPRSATSSAAGMTPRSSRWPAPRPRSASCAGR